MDGKVAVTSNMTVDFTVNPDFGQVEADPSEVNLTAFETRFQEKRPFFIEGNDILSLQLAPAITGGSFTDDNLFYSRRIGPPPHGDPTLSDGEYADVPSATSIIAAAKLTGHTAHGLSVGILESMTAKEQAQIAGASGPARSEAVEPLSNFLVGRLVQDIHQGNTRIGAMATSLNRHIDDPAHDDLLRSDAYIAGGDLLHQWHKRMWYVGATGALSSVRGSAPALVLTQRSSARYFQRPDNDYTSLDSSRTSLSGSAGSVRFGKQGGKHIRFETGGAWRTPGFEINDVGFMRVADEVDHFTWAGYSIRNPFAIFRRFQLNFNENLSWDFGGTRLQTRGNSNFNTNFKNNWATGGSVTRLMEWVSNSALRGGPSSAWPGWWNANGWVDTDYRKRFAMSFGGGTTVGDENSLRSANAWVDGTIRVSPAMQVTLSPSYSRNRDA